MGPEKLARNYITVQLENGRSSYGGDQSWLKTRAEQDFGCGLIAAADILRYLRRKEGRETEKLLTREEYLKDIHELSESFRIRGPLGITGFGIANYPISGVTPDGGAQPTQQPASGGTGGGNSALLGDSPEKLDVNDRGVVTIYYPGDQFVYNDFWDKLRNEETGVGILLDPMLGEANFEELKASYEEHNSDEEDYSLTETTINGYRALIMTYTDWLDSTMRVDIDFGGNHDGWYGISFSVSGDSLDDCNTDQIWAIIESMAVTA